MLLRCTAGLVLAAIAWTTVVWHGRGPTVVHSEAVLLPLSQTHHSESEVAACFDDPQGIASHPLVHVWSSGGELLGRIPAQLQVDSGDERTPTWGLALDSIGMGGVVLTGVDRPYHVVLDAKFAVLISLDNPSGIGQILCIEGPSRTDSSTRTARWERGVHGVRALGMWLSPQYDEHYRPRAMLVEWSAGKPAASFVALSRTGLVEVQLDLDWGAPRTRVVELRLPDRPIGQRAVWALARLPGFGQCAIVEAEGSCAVLVRVEDEWQELVRLPASPLHGDREFQVESVRVVHQDDGFALAVVTSSSPYTNPWNRYLLACWVGTITAPSADQMSVSSWLVPGTLSQDGWHAGIRLELAPHILGADRVIRATTDLRGWHAEGFEYFVAAPDRGPDGHRGE